MAVVHLNLHVVDAMRHAKVCRVVRCRASSAMGKVIAIRSLDHAACMVGR